jgi:SAM-dependent methyltransferase
MNKIDIINLVKKIYHFIYRPATGDHIRNYTEKPYGIKMIGTKLGRSLEIGCGAAGLYTRYLAENSSYLIALEIQQKYIEEARKRLSPLNNISFVRANAIALPFQNNSFDFVMCSQVLEHLEDDVGVIRQINKIMKNGGRFVVGVPMPPEPIKICHEQFDGHVREGYELKDIRQKLELYGFSVENYKYCFFIFGRMAIQLNEFFDNRIGIRLPAIIIIILSLVDRLIGFFIKIQPWILLIDAKKKKEIIN